MFDDIIDGNDLNDFFLNDLNEFNDSNDHTFGRPPILGSSQMRPIRHFFMRSKYSSLFWSSPHHLLSLPLPVFRFNGLPLTDHRASNG